MPQETTATLASRISSATPLGLLVISYELLLSNLALTKAKLDDTGAITTHANIVHCQNIVREITSGLNMDYELSKEVLPLYMYMSKLLTDCQIQSNKRDSEDFIKETLTHIEKIATTLLDGIRTLPDVDVPDSAPVYAGLTYNKHGKLSEYFPSDMDNKGYKA